MIPIYYKSSEGEIINLIETPYMMLTDTDLFNYEWEEVMVGNTLPFISKMKKKMKSSSFSIRITGQTENEMYNNLEHLTSIFDRDVYLNQIGRLYVGNYYIELFVKASQKRKVFKKNNTVVEFTCIANSDEWVSWQVSEYSGMSGDEQTEIAFSSRVFTNGVVDTIVNEDSALEVDFNTGAWRDDAYLMFDFNQEYDFHSISGLELTGSSGGSGQIVVETAGTSQTGTTRTVEIDGEYEITSEYSRVEIIDRTGGIEVYSYIGDTLESQHFLSSGEVLEFDVPERNYILNPVGDTATFEATFYQNNWITQATIPSTTTTVEIPTLTNKLARYVRIRNTSNGAFGIEGSLSAIIEEETTKNDLLKQGFVTTNCYAEWKQSTPITPDMELDVTPIDNTQEYMLELITENVLLSDIIGGASADVTIQAKETEESEWETIYTLEGMHNYNIRDIDTEYFKIRLKSTAPYLSIRFELLSINVPQLFNESYAPSEAIIRIYGQTNNPYVMIGETSYGADTQLEQDEYLEIDTKAKTVLRYRSDNSYENQFMNRLPDSFSKVPSGMSYLSWDGAFDKLEIELEGARSEPKWN